MLIFNILDLSHNFIIQKRQKNYILKMEMTRLLIFMESLTMKIIPLYSDMVMS